METAEAGPSRPRTIPSPSSARGATRSPSRLVVEIPSPRELLARRERDQRIFGDASPTRPSGPGTVSTSPPKAATASASTSPTRPGGFDHVVAALERAVDAPIERVKPARAEPGRAPHDHAPEDEDWTRSPPIELDPPARSTQHPPHNAASREMPPPPAPLSLDRSPSVDLDPPVRSSLRLPPTPNSRPPPQSRDMPPPPLPPSSPPPITGPVFVPPDVFAALTSAAASAQPPTPAAPAKLGPQNRAYVSIKISEKRRAELIARGVYDAFRDDEDESRRPRLRRKHQHVAFGANRIMLHNRPLVLARPEELPARFEARPGPALLEPYASLLTEETLLGTLGEYACGWKGCGAVLGSERLLARHVAKRAHAAQGAVHVGRTVYRCYWAGCEGPAFEAVEGLVQHLAARHVRGKLRCPYVDCEMASPTLAHLQRHVLRQHSESAPVRPLASAPPPATALPPLPPLPATAHTDELCTQRVLGRAHHSAYRQDQLRARIQKLCFGGPEPDTTVGGITMMEQLALTPQPPAEAPKGRGRKRKNWGWKRKPSSAVRVKLEPGLEEEALEAELRREAEERARVAEERIRAARERYERRRLGRVWVEIPVRDPAKAGIYERPDTPPPSPRKVEVVIDVPPPPAQGKGKGKRKGKRAWAAANGSPRPGPADAETSTKRPKAGFNTAVFDAFRAPQPAPDVAGDGTSEAEVDLAFDADFPPVLATPAPAKPVPAPSSTPAPASNSTTGAPRSGSRPKANGTPANGTPVTPAPRARTRTSSTTSASGGRFKPRHSVEVVLPRPSPRPVSIR